MLFCCLVGDVIPDWRTSLIWYDIVHRCGEPNDDSPASSQLVKTQICILHLPRELSEVLTIQIAPTRSRSSKKARGSGEPRSRFAIKTCGKTYSMFYRTPTEGNLLGPPSTSLSVFSIQSCWTRHAAELIKGQWLNRFPQSDPHNSSALRFHGETWGFPFFQGRLCETLRPSSDNISPVIPVNMCGGGAPCKAAGPSASEWPAKTAGRLSRPDMPLPVKTFKTWSDSGL